MKRIFFPVIVFCVSVFVLSILFAPLAGGADTGERTCKCWKCGKTFKAPIAAMKGQCPYCGAKYALKAPPPTPKAEPGVIRWEDAADYIGQTKTMEGVIVGTHLSERSRNLYLNFSRDFWNYISVKIPAARRGRFPANAESFYQGKKIRAKGQIRREGQYLRLEVSNPDDLKVIK